MLDVRLGDKWGGGLYLPDSNQQSKTSSILFRGALPFLEGMVMWSMLSRWRSVIPLTPESSSSSATDPMQTIFLSMAFSSVIPH